VLADSIEDIYNDWIFLNNIGIRGCKVEKGGKYQEENG